MMVYWMSGIVCLGSIKFTAILTKNKTNFNFIRLTESQILKAINQSRRHRNPSCQWRGIANAPIAITHTLTHIHTEVYLISTKNHE